MDLTWSKETDVTVMKRSGQLTLTLTSMSQFSACSFFWAELVSCDVPCETSNINMSES